jgi:GxxExxY protein
MEEEYRYKEITEKIIGAAYTVHNELGYGFLEKVYKNALIIEIRSAGLIVESEVPVKVYYHKQIIGEYYSDIIVEKKIIIEVKAVKNIIPIHEVQLLNYLKATGLVIGLLINFGYSVDIKRKIFKI